MIKPIPYFRAYDIRGTVPDGINVEAAYKVARAVAVWAGAEEIILEGALRNR
jgi:phosphomannomutase